MQLWLWSPEVKKRDGKSEKWKKEMETRDPLILFRYFSYLLFFFPSYFFVIYKIKFQFVQFVPIFFFFCSYVAFN